jgi:dihydropteroate synthase
MPAPLRRPPTHWRCGRFALALDRVQVMGVLNVTPDSFSDGGRHMTADAALARALQMVEEGADIIDVGGESTRPGAAPVSAQEELQRVLPVLRGLRRLTLPVSIDTSQPAVIEAALALGVSIINDVRALRVAGALEAVRGSDCGLVLMHMQGEPATMQARPAYADVVAEVDAWLRERRDQVCAQGIGADRIALDPGFGFGKTHAHNRRLLACLRRFTELGQPLLVGLSRKSSLGNLTGRPVAERMAASVAAALIAMENGAQIVRVHDVAATRDAVAVWSAVRAAGRAAESDPESGPATDLDLEADMELDPGEGAKAQAAMTPQTMTDETEAQAMDGGKAAGSKVGTTASTGRRRA